jgi:dolichol-phosphate mannosyltransferase
MGLPVNEPTLSAIIPLFDEGPNLEPLHRQLRNALNGLGVSWEVVYVDDGSSDEGPAVLAALAERDACVHVVRLARNYGQSTALVAGIEAARGEWIATLDADLQNDPADLAGLWESIEAGRADIVTGVRTRRGDSWLRRVSSTIANAVRNRLTGDRVTDVGCSLRVFPRQAFLESVQFEGMHRFLPTLLGRAGYSVIEHPVSHRPRREGRSKYGIHNRLWTGLADLFMVRRLLHRRIDYQTRPLGDSPGAPSEKEESR